MHCFKYQLGISANVEILKNVNFTKKNVDLDSRHIIKFIEQSNKRGFRNDQNQTGIVLMFCKTQTPHKMDALSMN